ncbi:hypothetical protein Tco_1087772, partial [Tanacetum coccineum]
VVNAALLLGVKMMKKLRPVKPSSKSKRSLSRESEAEAAAAEATTTTS